MDCYVELVKIDFHRFERESVLVRYSRPSYQLFKQFPPITYFVAIYTIIPCPTTPTQHNWWISRISPLVRGFRVFRSPFHLFGLFYNWKQFQNCRPKDYGNFDHFSKGNATTTTAFQINLPSKLRGKPLSNKAEEYKKYHKIIEAFVEFARRLWRSWFLLKLQYLWNQNLNLYYGATWDHRRAFLVQ